MNSNNQIHHQWSSRRAFILAAIGGAVGLGNLWRFSAEAGNNGGGAFIALYFICIVLVGIPTIMAELLIGRAGNARGAASSMQELAMRSHASKVWQLGAWIGIASSFLIVSFYGVIAAWVLVYIPKFLGNAFVDMTPDQISEQFSVVTNSPGQLVLWYLTFSVATITLVARGLNKGIELTSRWLMPGFFCLLVGLSVYSLVSAWSSGASAQAFGFLFDPDLSKLSGSVALSAMGQAFFSLGLGMAMMLAYGSYLPANVDLPNAALTIGICDTAVAIMAGLAIFPIVFQYGLDFDAGAGLFFQTLPIALNSVPGGAFIGTAFFVMAAMAALTTSVALLEPIVAQCAEQLNVAKSICAVAAGAVMILIGLACLFIPEFLTFLDTGLTAPLLLPTSALIVVVFVGWRLQQTIVLQQLSGASKPLARLLVVLVRYVAPIFIATILVTGTLDTYF